jgi:hypothetical protein
LCGDEPSQPHVADASTALSLSAPNILCFHLWYAYFLGQSSAMRPIPWPKLICAFVGIALLTSLLICVTAPHRDAPNGLAWMTPPQLSKSLSPGPFTRLKYRFLRLPGPFWRWYMSGREHIQIESRLVTLTAEAARRNVPLSLCSTNHDGMCAWILSAEELTILKQHIKDLPEATVSNMARISTYDGGEAQVSTSASAAVTTNPAVVGLTVDVLPRVARQSLYLLVGTTSTDVDSLPDGTVVGSKTNFAAAVQVLLPNGGGLVLESKNLKDSAAPTYWFILSSTAIDAIGKPKKL